MCNSLTITSAVEDLENKMVALIGKNNDTIWASWRNGRAARSAANLTRILMPMVNEGFALKFSEELILAIDKLKLLQENREKIEKTGGFIRTSCGVKIENSSNTEEKINQALDLLGRLKELSNPSSKGDSEPSETSTSPYPTISWKTLFSPRSFDEKS